MQQGDIEKGLLVISAWRLAVSTDPWEMLAIMCTIRNWIVPHQGQIAHFFKSYTEAVQHFYDNYPLRPLPITTNLPVFTDLSEGIQYKVDEVYSGKYPDITGSDNNPFGARYFGRATNPSPESFFFRNVISQQGAHPLIGHFGSQAFYE